MTAVSGIKRLTKIQLGREVTPGVAVVATTVRRGLAVPPSDDRMNVRPDENVGLSSPSNRQYTAGLLATLEPPTTEATFEMFQHVGEGGLKTVAPVQDGAGSGYVSVYPVPHQDSFTTKTYTLEAGNQKIVEKVEYGFVTEFTLEGKKNEAWKLTEKWQGRQCTIMGGGFTAGLTIPAVREMLFNTTKFYLDNVGGTIGSTQLVNTVVGAKIHVVTGLKAQHTGDGNLYFSFMDFIGAKCDVELTMLNNASSLAERVLWRSNTARLLRIKIEDNKALTSPGTTYSYRTLLADFAGIYSQFGDPRDEDEGSAAHKVMFECGYDETAALFAQFTNVNELTAVP
jgi:hypothetical protein